jgi:MFS family permease
MNRYSGFASFPEPQLESDFGARLDLVSIVSWVAVAYLVTMTGFLPIFGRLADIVGRKLLYIGGFLLFVLGSGLCGFAPSLPLLIGFRVIQAIGAALLASNSIAIVVTAAGPNQRGRALGIQAAAQAVGLSVGPVIGGLVLTTLGWRWAFWINVDWDRRVHHWLVRHSADAQSPRRAIVQLESGLLFVAALTTFIAVITEARVWGAPRQPSTAASSPR